MSEESNRLAVARAHRMYDANRKSAGVAYLLCIFLGGVGAHRFYLGRSGTGAAQWALWLLGWVTLFIYDTSRHLGSSRFVLIPGILREENMNLPTILRDDEFGHL